MSTSGSVEVLQPRVDKPFRFTSNGLLSESASNNDTLVEIPSIAQGERDRAEDMSNPTPTSRPSLTFASNGLLGLSSQMSTGESSGAPLLEEAQPRAHDTPDAGVSAEPTLIPLHPSSKLSFGTSSLLSSVTPPESSAGASLKFGFSTLMSTESHDTLPEPSTSSLAFKSSGLLSQAAGSSSTNDTSDLMEADDDLPTLSQLVPRAQPNKALPTYLHRPPIRATTFDGRNISFARRRKLESVVPTQNQMPSGGTSTLLEVPIHRMLDQLALSAASTDDSAYAGVAQVDTHQTTSQSRMWVDRYRPKQFVDLVGDERVHRETMTWVKEWDQCVFNRKKQKGRKRTWGDEDGEDRGTDEWGRPYEKLLLLSGPPGLGKTTLAHVVANQAGYSVLEVNASDSRSGSIIDERIKPALDAGRMIGATKPVLVVIDEIDGATGENTGSFINRLIQLATEKPKRKARHGEKRDPKEKKPLLRPIICICNDLWATPLSRLRSHARVVRFNPALPTLLVKRLRDICSLEGLPAESRALTNLVAVCKGDMRGCLNTLQFIHRKCQTVCEQTVRLATAGIKENESTTQDVWNDLFVPMAKRRVKELGLTEVDESKYVGRLSRLVGGTGNTDKIVIGCFEHYANLHQYDPTFQRYEGALEWLGTYDGLSSRMRSEQEYALLEYLPYAVVPFYHLFAATTNPKVERPKADWECHVKTKANEEIYTALASSALGQGGRVTPGHRYLFNRPVLQTEFIPLLNRIISPPLRPVHSQVIKPEEKALLKRLVDIMVSFELQFLQEKTEEGQMVYRLEPPIDVFVTYDEKRAADIAVSRYAIRHMVAMEIDAQLAVRQAEAVEKTKTDKMASFFGTKKTQSDPDGHPRKKQNTGKVDLADMPPTDFFGRLVVRPPPSSSGPAATGSEEASGEKVYRIAYRFNEGMSAAVRRPVKVASFL